MKHFLCLSFAALLLASCAQEVKEPAVKKPAPPPAILITNTAGRGTPTISSSLTGATITVDSPHETGVVTYYNTEGCVRARFEAMTSVSPYGPPTSAYITPRACSGSSLPMYNPPSTWQSYNTEVLALPGGALQIVVIANQYGHYASLQIRNLVWY